MRIFLLLSVIGAISGKRCPDPCSCNEAGVVLCEMLGLDERPKIFPNNMTVLSLNHNKLGKFSVQGLQTQMLQSLSMRNNSIAVFLDKDRNRYPNLEELDLSMNNLRWISMGLFQRMRKLQKLDLSHNSIMSLSSMRIPPFVWKMDLSYNKIDEIPDKNFLRAAKNLMELNLSHNKIKDVLPNTFIGLPHLGLLNLDGNQIRELRNNVFYGLLSCYKILLRDNRISDIRPRAFLNVGVEIRGGEMAPKVIDLRNNGINIVLADWVDSLGGDRNFCSTHVCPEPFQLLLKSNPIYCDCNMQQVRDNYEAYFADINLTLCANNELTNTTISEFHDEICCNPQFSV